MNLLDAVSYKIYCDPRPLGPREVVNQMTQYELLEMISEMLGDNAVPSQDEG